MYEKSKIRILTSLFRKYKKFKRPANVVLLDNDTKRNEINRKLFIETKSSKIVYITKSIDFGGKTYFYNLIENEKVSNVPISC